MWLPTLWRLPSWLSGRAIARGKTDRAVGIAARYVRLRPSDPSAWIVWSRTIIDAVEAKAVAGGQSNDDGSWPAGTFAEAEEVIRRGLEVHPEDVSLRVELAEIGLMRSKRENNEAKEEEAEAIYAGLYREFPDDLVVLMGMLNGALRRKDWPAFDLFASKLEQNISASDEPELFSMFLSTLPFAANGRPRARVMLERAIKVEPDHAGWRALLGLMLEDEDPGAAQRAFETGRDLLGAAKFDAKLVEMRDVLMRFGPNRGSSEV